MADPSTRRLELWTRGLITGLSALSLALVWVLFLASTLGERMKAEEAQRERMEKANNALAEALAQHLGGARLSLEILARTIASNPSRDALRSRDFLSLVQALRYRSFEQWDLRAFDASGHRLVFDGPPLSPAESIADDEGFRRQVPFPGAGFWVSRPRFDVQPPTGTLILSQAVPPHQGELAVLGIFWSFDALDRLVATLGDLGSDEVSLYRSDGVLVYRFPHPFPFPTDSSNGVVPSLLALGTEGGHLVGDRLMAYHRVEDTGLWLVTSRPASQLSQDWLRGVLTQGLWVGLLSVFLVVATLLLLRFMARLRAIRLEQERLARSDPLTGLLNRRAFLERCDLERVRASRQNEPMCLLLLDLDHFKEVNDRFGHQEGDRVLRDLAAVLLRTLRTSDAVARVGGEEFAILLPNTAEAPGLETAERLRSEVATIALPEGFQTTSLGLALWDGQESFESWYRRADRALYVAKEAGRNRVEVSLSTA